MMRSISKGGVIVACSVCLGFGWLLGAAGPARLTAQQPGAKKVEAPALPEAARLGANLYLQASAEYRACCYGIYKSATMRLETMLQSVRPKPEFPAVVMDLDETVLDNSAFQTFLYKNHLEYTEDRWADYEEHYPQDVTLIPGASEFIQQATAWGVTVVYISNRSEAFKKSTIEAMHEQGLSSGGLLEERLYLKPVNGSSDKAARREAVAAKYNVLMYFGDNLRDFSEAFANAKLPANATAEDRVKLYKERAAKADEAQGHWGVDWFVLPNPVYGEWDRAIGPDPAALMHPTSMAVKGR